MYKLTNLFEHYSLFHTDALIKFEQVRTDKGKTMKRFDVIITDLQMPVMDG